MLPSILIIEDMREKRLIEILPDFAAPERPMSLLYLQERQKSPKLRSFTEFVVEQFGADTGRPT